MSDEALTPSREIPHSGSILKHQHSSTRSVSSGKCDHTCCSVEKWCHRQAVFGSVCLWVSAWVHESLHLQKPCECHISKTNEGWREFYPILFTDAFGFIDVLIRFWGQKVKGKSLWMPYLKNQWREFHPILVSDVFGFTAVLISFWCQKVNVKVTAGNDPESQSYIVSPYCPVVSCFVNVNASYQICWWECLVGMITK